MEDEGFFCPLCEDRGGKPLAFRNADALMAHYEKVGDALSTVCNIKIKNIILFPLLFPTFLLFLPFQPTVCFANSHVQFAPCKT